MHMLDRLVEPNSTCSRHLLVRESVWFICEGFNLPQVLIAFTAFCDRQYARELDIHIRLFRQHQIFIGCLGILQQSVNQDNIRSGDFIEVVDPVK